MNESRAGRRGWRSRLALLLVVAQLGGCALPTLRQRPPSFALDDAPAAATALGRAAAPVCAAHPGRSGIHALADPGDAFVARALLAGAAERTLDVQYYIWRGDVTGTLLLQALAAAADRGVRVRLLLDDNGTAGLDDALAALDAHPNIEVRLFNPFAVRAPRLLGFLTDFPRANRRMHNKSFTVDNRATIVGGRNIGDEYFGAAAGTLFADLDVLAVGPVVGQVSSQFDRYWASASAYPLRGILAPAGPEALAELAGRARRLEDSPAAARYVRGLRDSSFVRDLLAGRLALDWATTRMVSDAPLKGLGLASDGELLTHQLVTIVGAPSSELELISPYFVPTEAGLRAFVAQRANGVRVRIFTNSLEATDVVAVHAGYARWRKALLESGVVLYEMRRTAPPALGRQRRAGRFGSAASSLHAKTFVVDGERVFVGSFNFDPRSARLNTELGFVIDSPRLAQRIERYFTESIPQHAYEVRLDAHGRLYWLERRGGELVRHASEPGASLWRRAGAALLSVLPLEGLL